MIKIYRKTATIRAEQFDSSDAMVEKYHIEYDGAYILPFRIETPDGWLGIKAGDWISTGVNGVHWPIADDVFKKTYAELPVIPDYVTNLIESYKVRGWGLMRFMSEQYLKYTSDYSFWINDNPEVIARAWLDGYTVEEKHD